MKSGLIEDFRGCIESVVHNKFSQTCRPGQRCVDTVYELMLGTQQLRYGSRPGSDAEETMKRGIAHFMENGLPINVCVPWGSEKPDLSRSCDITELMAFRQLETVNETVKQVYEPGLSALMRVEDHTGTTLFDFEPSYQQSSQKYCTDLRNLGDILGLSFLDFHLESEVLGTRASDFDSKFQAIWPKFCAYLNDSDEVFESEWEALSAYQTLKSLGWIGLIPKTQRDYYKAYYERTYPTWSKLRVNEYLAKYFAQALVRYEFGLTGKRTVHDIKLHFYKSVPGTSKVLERQSIYYRTMPLRFTDEHIPPWRAIGYVQIRKGDTGFVAKPKLTALSNQELVSKLVPEITRLGGHKQFVELRTDWIQV